MSGTHPDSTVFSPEAGVVAERACKFCVVEVRTTVSAEGAGLV